MFGFTSARYAWPIAVPYPTKSDIFLHRILKDLGLLGLIKTLLYIDQQHLIQCLIYNNENNLSLIQHYYCLT